MSTEEENVAIEYPLNRTREDSVTTPVGGSNGGHALVDLIQHDLAELANAKDIIIPIKGYETSGLAVKYRMPEKGKELDDIGTKVEKLNKDRYYQSLWTGVDIMIYLCEGLYVKPDDVEEYIMLDPEEFGEPVRFDGRMAVLTGLAENTPSRQIVRRVFGNNDMAVLAHFERLNRWLTNTKADIDKELWQTVGG